MNKITSVFKLVAFGGLLSGCAMWNDGYYYQDYGPIWPGEDMCYDECGYHNHRHSHECGDCHMHRHHDGHHDGHHGGHHH